MTIQEVGYLLAALLVAGFVIGLLTKRSKPSDPFFDEEEEQEEVKREYIPSFSEEHDSHFEG